MAMLMNDRFEFDGLHRLLQLEPPKSSTLLANIPLVLYPLSKWLWIPSSTTTEKLKII